MPEKTKQEKDINKHKNENGENPSVDSPLNEKKSSRAQDQREKSYYYDDAHGYEIYNPEEDDEEDGKTVSDA